MLTNLCDDDSGNGFDQSYVPSDLSYSDILILNRLKEVLRDMKKGYDTYDFMSVTNALTNFLVNDLSSFYLDYSKDTLYCDKKDSVRRRNTQYVLFNIVKSLSVAYSPILCFTAEEIYDSLSLKDRKASISLESYPDLGPVDEKISADYQILTGLRAHVTSLMEPVRQNGTIGSSSEASVTYKPEEEEKPLLDRLGNKELARMFIVSSFEEGETSLVCKHTGEKCERCWNYFDDIEEEDGKHLCHRCHEVVTSLKEKE